MKKINHENSEVLLPHVCKLVNNFFLFSKVRLNHAENVYVMNTLELFSTKRIYLQFFLMLLYSTIGNIIDRGSHWRRSVRQGVLRNFAKLTGKHVPVITLQAGLRHRCSFVNFAKFLQIPFLKNISGWRVAASWPCRRIFTRSYLSPFFLH